MGCNFIPDQDVIKTMSRILLSVLYFRMFYIFANIYSFFYFLVR